MVSNYTENFDLQGFLPKNLDVKRDSFWDTIFRFEKYA